MPGPFLFIFTQCASSIYRNIADASKEDKANEALRHYTFLLKLKERKSKEQDNKAHEKAYRKNFYKYAKDITKGTFGQETIAKKYLKKCFERQPSHIWTHWVYPLRKTLT